MIRIREYKKQDIEQVAGLITELGYPTSPVEMESRMGEIFGKSDYRTLVAEEEGEVTGLIGMIKLNYWEKNGCYIKIQALVVSKKARKKGTGKLLLDHANEWARQNNADLLALTCGMKIEREDAHIFYPEVGFVWNAKGYVRSVR